MDKDYYKIIDDWQKVKSLLLELEDYMNDFLRHPTRKPVSIRARKKSKEIEQLNHQIRTKIIRQRKIFDSDYS